MNKFEVDGKFEIDLSTPGRVDISTKSDLGVLGFSIFPDKPGPLKIRVSDFSIMYEDKVHILEQHE